MATGIISTGGTAARPYGFKTRARRGRIISAGSPYHAVRRPTGTFLGVVKVAPADRPGVPAVTERLAALVEAGPSPDWQEELAFKTQHWHRMLALASIDRERGEPAPPREQLDAIALAPEDAAELERRRAMAPDDVTALLLVGLIRSGVARRARRTCARCSGRGRCRRRRSTARRRRILEHDEDRELLNSAVKGSDGFFTTFFVSTYSKYIARWAAQPRADAEPGDDDLGRGRRAGRRRLRDRRAPVDGGGRGAPLLRLRARLRRRPARPLHAPVLQARRLARLDLRPHEGVRRVRRPRHRREPHRRSGLAARRRRPDDADRPPRDRLLLSRLAAPGDRGRAAAADRGPVRRPTARLPAHAAGRRRGGGLAARAAAAGHGRARDPAAAPGQAVAGDRPCAGAALGQEDHHLPDRRALRGDLDHRGAVLRAHGVHRPAGVGRRRGRLRPRRPDRSGRSWHDRRDRLPRPPPPPSGRACSSSTATTGRSPQPSAPRPPAGCAAPAIALLFLAALPGLVAIVRRGRRRRATAWSPARSSGPC